MNVGIYIYDQAEVLDFSGPFEVFSTASRVCATEDPFTVFLIGETGEMIRARGSYCVVPAFNVSNHPDVDVLLISGGLQVNEMRKERVMTWLAGQAGKAELIASVCTGVFLLAEAGIVTNHRVTTHWEDIPDLAGSYPDLRIRKEQRWVDEGAIVTSGGISAGIDMSLYLVSRLHSQDLAEQTARQMEYDWKQIP